MSKWNDNLEDVLADCSIDNPCGDCADCEQDRIDRNRSQCYHCGTRDAWHRADCPNIPE